MNRKHLVTGLVVLAALMIPAWAYGTGMLTGSDESAVQAPVAMGGGCCGSKAESKPAAGCDKSKCGCKCDPCKCDPCKCCKDTCPEKCEQGCKGCGGAKTRPADAPKGGCGGCKK